MLLSNAMKIVAEPLEIGGADNSPTSRIVKRGVFE
jgi:hypothetical protein